MEKLTYLLLLAAIVGVIQCQQPIFLTQYIESNTVQIGKAAALVQHTDLLRLGITSYSGYFTVNKIYDSNLFFWYFPAKTNQATAPVVLWLQGGPGASSLYGCLMENGPVKLNSEGKLVKRQQQHSWTQHHNMLYIDNPVGTGFSYTNEMAGYAKNQTDVAADLFSAIRQFFQVFPEIKNNRFYIAGESYGGKFATAAAYAIYSKRTSADPRDRINLKGIAIGNGFTDPVHQLELGDYYYELGFIDKAALSIFNQYQNVALSYIAQNNSQYALHAFCSLVNSDGCLFNNLTGFTSTQNYLSLNGYDDQMKLVNDYILNSGIANSLHVGTRTFVPFSANNDVLANLLNDYMDSVAPWIATLADNYQVLIYDGQLDLLVSTTLTEDYLSRLRYSGASAFKIALRNQWKVDNVVAGYYKKGGLLTHATIRLAGSMAPFDQPVWTYDLLRKLTLGIGF